LVEIMAFFPFGTDVAGIYTSKTNRENNVKHIEQLAAAAVFATASCAAQATTVYTNEAGFLAAAGGSLPFESFEAVQSSTATQVKFTDVSFSCAGSVYCPGFFGVSGSIVHDGAQAAYFASPDTSTFTFTQAINAFGIWIGGAGDVAPINLNAALDNGVSAAALSNYSHPGTATWQYFGIITDTPFTSLTFRPDNFGDGIFFDALSYRQATVTAVPEPASVLLLGIAGAGLLASRRRAARR
jgi:hypothetical protein